MAGVLRPPSPAIVTTLARAYMYEIAPATRALLYSFTVTYISMFLYSGTEESGKNFFADVDNPFNQYLVKWAWGWTLALVSLHHLVQPGPWDFSKEGLGKACRLAMGHMVWYLGARLAFPWFEEATGVCKASHFTSRRACYKGNSIWTGFDTSGHCFLLTFNNLLISEETAESRKGKLEIIQKKKNGDGDNKQQEGEEEQPFAWSRLLLCLLMLVWDVMIICTSLYFHTFLEKVLGTACGVGAWYLLYRVLYPLIRAAIS